ncbi:AMP-binding protein [Aromatoleum toluclasticum]|uniref:AMP-binding protein n=1 Tax=Aromatoleum toluclasticum TaxID=92003 RepID=UPI001D187607|nr:AMP-binding protein [Aromatoleum toluclasticum]MCC4118207.1 AMP-binding protein [Aromatoleum toluclasticum]
MKQFHISEARDIARISAQPYEQFMRHGSVFAALTDAAQQYSQRNALSFISVPDPTTPARTWTYTELATEITRTANLFHKLAGGEEPRIAMLLPAIPEAYFTLWGGEAAGVVCPINYLLNAEHIGELIRAARANILVALGPNPDLDIWSRVPQLRAECPGLRHVLAVGAAPHAVDFSAAAASMPGGALVFDRKIGPTTLAALFHTGGTTGAPKLAQHTHGNQLHAAWGAAQMYATTERDVMLNGFPLFHVAGAFVFGLSTLLSGGEVVLPTLLGMRNAEFVRRYWTFADRHGVSLLAAVPTVIASLMNTDPGGARMESVRALLTGGSPLPTELASAFERRFDIPVRNILGMTECAGVISIEPFHAPRTAGSCGLPLPFTEVVAVAENGRACLAGEEGVLRVRGPNVGPGYTDPRRNTGTFSEDGWLITGDIGHVDAEGRIFVTGRAKDVIIRSSHNIDPRVIEDALLMHPCVQMAAAVGEPDEYAGEMPVAFVSLKPGAQLAPDELAAFIERHIPERPAFPRRIDIIPTIPVTAIGKVYKPALRALAMERVVQERLTDAGLAGRVEATVVESASGPSMRFVIMDENLRLDLEARVREVMGPFAVSFDFQH